MIELIKEVLNELKNIDGWKIEESKVISREMFFVRKEMDMNRGKDVHNFKVIVYRDFEEDGVKYRGSSTTKVHPTMNKEEVKEVINTAAYAASFIKNKYYPLVKIGESSNNDVKSNFEEAPINNWLPKLSNALYSQDIYEDGGINSSEFFLNHIYIRIVNSEGVDVSFKKYKGNIEFITNWTGKKEEIELYRNINFANFNEELIKEKVKEMLEMSKGRAEANPMPSLGHHMVILNGEAVRDIFNYYYSKANAQMVHEKISTAKINESIQGESIEGDKINMSLNPFIQDSTDSAPYDEEGFPLKKVNIIENGVLKRYWGDIRYSYYTGMEPTGNIKNIVVDAGSKSIAEMKKEPYLELLSFSNFQMDPFTGFFGGEVRFGRYFDGEKIIPVTGGSVTGNINNVHGRMYFSKEMQTENNFIGPKAIQMYNIAVGGN